MRHLAVERDAAEVRERGRTVGDLHAADGRGGAEAFADVDVVRVAECERKVVFDEPDSKEDTKQDAPASWAISMAEGMEYSFGPNGEFTIVFTDDSTGGKLVKGVRNIVCTMQCPLNSAILSTSRFTS